MANNLGLYISKQPLIKQLPPINLFTFLFPKSIDYFSLLTCFFQSLLYAYTEYRKGLQSIIIL